MRSADGGVERTGANLENRAKVGGAKRRARVGGGRAVSIHGVRVCHTCRTVWHRDVLAALNMRALFLHMNAHDRVRPAAFAHPGAFTSQLRTATGAAEAGPVPRS